MSQITIQQLKIDFTESLELLRVSRPQNILIGDDEYWERYHKLIYKYFPEELDEDENE